MTAARSTRSRPLSKRSFVIVRVLVAALVGVVGGGLVGSLLRAPTVAPSSGWICFALVFLLLTWRAIWGMDARETASHATREDPTAALSGTILTVACIASLGAVALLLSGNHQGGKVLDPALAVTSVALAWFLVHTVFTLKYAALYYTGRDGGVDFNQQEEPDYADFAYLALTIGMTYQISDTPVGRRAIRRSALRHALLSYLLGAIVLAATVNLIAGLAK